MKYKSSNYYSPNDSNTFCDVTGFKRKKSELRKRWDNIMCIEEAWHTRQPQDTPIIPITQKVFTDIRVEQVDPDDVTSFDPI